MNKGEFYRAVADKVNVTLKDTGVVLEGALEVLVETLKKGEKVTIPGFGSYELVKKAATTKINPLTKKPVKVAACKQPKFKFGKSFKALFN